MASRAADKHFPFRLAHSQSFLFCNYFSFFIAKSKRFGGVGKHAQAIKYSTLCPICYSHCCH